MNQWEEFLASIVGPDNVFLVTWVLGASAATVALGLALRGGGGKW